MAGCIRSCPANEKFVAVVKLPLSEGVSAVSARPKSAYARPVFGSTLKKALF
jgi:hypothetical protein